MAVAGGSASSRARGNFQAERGSATVAGTVQGRWSGAAPRSVQAGGAMPALGEAEGCLFQQHRFSSLPWDAEMPNKILMHT